MAAAGGVLSAPARGLAQEPRTEDKGTRGDCGRRGAPALAVVGQVRGRTSRGPPALLGRPGCGVMSAIQALAAPGSAGCAAPSPRRAPGTGTLVLRGCRGRRNSLLLKCLESNIRFMCVYFKDSVPRILTCILWGCVCRCARLCNEPSSAERCGWEVLSSPSAGGCAGGRPSATAPAAGRR